MTGRPDYDVGDLVCCVDASQNRGNGIVPSSLRVGGVYRVASFCLASGTASDGWCVRLEGMTASTRWGFMAWRFRKVRSLPESLTSLLAKDIPMRVKEEA